MASVNKSDEAVAGLGGDAYDGPSVNVPRMNGAEHPSGSKRMGAIQSSFDPLSPAPSKMDLGVAPSGGRAILFERLI
ncbi:hypothetical protein CDO27_24890 (plasmid) [Sinorhizobium meliloti]|nr:hypothetical protein CDO27_24890 [Sinorhizobium meliloti]CCM70733.1 hypothetical protein BN406_04451 [Sinorhizobium meliloti Rm41]